jgi:hypothetical protein
MGFAWAKRLRRFGRACVIAASQLTISPKTNTEVPSILHRIAVLDTAQYQTQ